METTIVAIATPIGTGGVGVIRLSGANSLSLLQKIFTPQKKQEFTPRKLVFGHIEFKNVWDDCLAVYFKAPHSFTGEDVVEIQMHGGAKLLEETVSALIEKGAVMAQPGEFSKRAVLNGKMDITKAEGLSDMIYAQSLCEMQVASTQMRGMLYQKIVEIQNRLKELIATIEVALDFPEHEETFAEEKLKNDLPNIIDELKKLIQTEQVGTKIKNGVNVSLVGAPNVGKSSLLNALLGYDRAIVTNIAGTTRDTISDTYTFNNVRFNIVDTAGIRESTDVVEKEGIKRSFNAINESDLSIFLFDSDENFDENAKIFDENAKKFAENAKNLTHSPKNIIKVLNKIDEQKTYNKSNYDIEISAKNNLNIDELKELIYQKTIDKNLLSSQIIITNLRQAKLLKEAVLAVQKLQKDLDFVYLDMAAVLIREAWEKLGEITGETANEKIIDTIFSKFCLGK
ncbi:MAG: tRNA uridine-5-carboxymethylaminomethyl(34) synthesis GTPase MnmE [Clostridia bacterium]|nr:tRNA uridine-5-carboxymethylaminomethyl(34) synthesis GTPase MnmE [Clostridia bacterium]